MLAQTVNTVLFQGRLPSSGLVAITACNSAHPPHAQPPSLQHPLGPAPARSTHCCELLRASSKEMLTQRGWSHGQEGSVSVAVASPSQAHATLDFGHFLHRWCKVKPRLSTLRLTQAWADFAHDAEPLDWCTELKNNSVHQCKPSVWCRPSPCTQLTAQCQCTHDIMRALTLWLSHT